MKTTEVLVTFRVHDEEDDAAERRVRAMCEQAVSSGDEIELADIEVGPELSGIPEIDALDVGRMRFILAELFTFMYQHEDGTWDRDKEIPGSDMVDLLCSLMPRLDVDAHPTPAAPETEAEKLTKELESKSVPEDALDDLVHDLASGLGSDVNNEGVEGQVKFILERLGPEPGAKAIQEVIAQHPKEST